MQNQNAKFKISRKFLVLSFGFSLFVLNFSLLGCGSGAIIEQIQNTPAEGGSLNLSPQDNVYVIAASYTDPVGSIAAVGLNNPHPVQKALAITDSSDVVIRSFEGKLYVINRGSGTIQAIDPSSFTILGNYSVGAESNPHDLVIANGKAFITRFDADSDTTNKDDLWVVEPLSGKLLTSIDLKPFTTDDGDRLARADQMALVGDSLYILIQDLSNAFKATTNGKVVIINTITNAVTSQAIQLVGRNPYDIAYSSSLGRLFITDWGVFDSQFNIDPTTPYGGIEVIDVATNQTLGILMDDADFGGDVSVLRLASDSLAVVTVKSAAIATFDPKNLQIINKSLYTSPGGFVPELLIDKNALLWIPERSPKNSGVLLMDPNTGATIAGPFQVGALPASMTLIK